MILVSVNGEKKDTISVLDRGFLYGDSVYEVCPGYGEKLFLYDEHLARMKRNAELLEIPAPFGSWDKIKGYIQSLRKDHPEKDHYIRWIVTRGVTPISLSYYDDSTSTLVIVIQPLNEFPLEVYKKGLRLKISSIERVSKKALDPKIKSGNYLNNIRAFNEVKMKGYDDALMINPQGHISEGTTANVFFVQKNEVHTPLIEDGILDGITRAFLKNKIFPKLGLKYIERSIDKKEYKDFSECFLSSSVKGIVPVVEIEDKTYESPKLESLTWKIKNSYDQEKRA